MLAVTTPPGLERSSLAEHGTNEVQRSGLQDLSVVQHPLVCSVVSLGYRLLPEYNLYLPPLHVGCPDEAGLHWYVALVHPVPEANLEVDATRSLEP